MVFHRFFQSTMSRAFRILLNTIRLNSPYIFEDGSGISYHAQFDILRYDTRGQIPRILDIGLNYDSRTRLLRIDAREVWRWRDPLVPLHTANESGPALTQSEREDIIRKLNIFRSKHPKKFELN
jgi:hypothetical protein